MNVTKLVRWNSKQPMARRIPFSVVLENCAIAKTRGELAALHVSIRREIDAKLAASPLKQFLES